MAYFYLFLLILPYSYLFRLLPSYSCLFLACFHWFPSILTHSFLFIFYSLLNSLILAYFHFIFPTNSLFYLFPFLDYDPAPLSHFPKDLAILDMSFVDYRNVCLIHIDYTHFSSFIRLLYCISSLHFLVLFPFASFRCHCPTSWSDLELFHVGRLVGSCERFLPSLCLGWVDLSPFLWAYYWKNCSLLHRGVLAVDLCSGLVLAIFWLLVDTTICLIL